MQTGLTHLRGWCKYRLPSLTSLALCTALMVPGLAAQEATQTRTETGVARIAPAAGGRLQFTQRGDELILPTVDRLNTSSLTLPGKWIVESVARSGDGTWISGRSNAADIDDMFLARVGAAGEIELLPTPPGREHPRGRTGLLVDRERVVGIAWLEGTSQDTTSVRAAEWNGTTWGPPEIVAPPLGREQTLLDSTALTDGSWMTVWAAVDGDAEPDDDIWWSRRDRGSWSDPQRLHTDNEVPDIHPLLAPVDRGAVVAWTAYDGSDYRIHVANFDGGEWHEQPFTGGKGAIPRRFLGADDSTALAYTSVIPEAWNLVGVDASGRAVRRLALSSAAEETPFITDLMAEPTARWPATEPGTRPTETPFERAAVPVP